MSLSCGSHFLPLRLELNHSCMQLCLSVRLDQTCRGTGGQLPDPDDRCPSPGGVGEQHHHHASPVPGRADSQFPGHQSWQVCVRACAYVGVHACVL